LLWFGMAEPVILPDSARPQHIGFHLRIKGALRRAAPALDPQTEPTQISIEADFFGLPPNLV